MNKFTKVLGILSIAAVVGSGSALAAKKNPSTDCMVSPSNKGVVTELPQQITITFPGVWSAMSFEGGVSSVNVELTLPDGTTKTLTVGENNLGVFGADEYAGFQINVPEVYTAAGEYSFVCPADMFYNFDWDFSQPFTIKYTVGESGSDPNDPVDPTEPGIPSGVEVIPAPNEEAVDAESLAGDVYLTFGNYQFPGDVTGAVVNMEGPDGYTKSFQIEKGLREVTEDDVTTTYPDNRRLVFTLAATDFPKSGTYKFTTDLSGLETVPADKGQTITWEYIVNVTEEPDVPTVPALEFAVTPDPEVVYSEIPSEITINFNNVLAVMSYSGAWDLKVRMVCEANDVDETLPTSMVGMGKGIKISIPGGYMDPGKYDFTVLFGDDYKYYTEEMQEVKIENDYTFSYTVGGFTTRIVPGAGKIDDELSEVSITFIQAETVKATEQDGLFVTFKNAIGNDLPFKVAYTGNEMKVTLDTPVTSNGIYTLVIPARFLEVDGNVYDREIRLEYRIEKVGTQAVIAEGAEADVYGVDGRIVIRNANADALRGLEKGIYVVKGQKVLVK